MPCGAAVSVLLFLLWSLLEVHSLTVPNLTFMGETLPDHSYVDLSALGDIDNVDDHVVCHTDLTSCCGGDNFNDRGFWFFPNGAELPGARYAATNPIVLMRDIQLVRLIRGTGPGDVPSPTNVMGTIYNSFSIEVRWTPPIPTDAVTGYIVYYSRDDGSNEAVHVTGGSTNSHILTELSTNINYMISVATTSSQYPRSDLVHAVNPIKIGNDYIYILYNDSLGAFTYLWPRSYNKL